MAYGQINWGDYRQMPDYRQFLPNKNASPIASLGRTLDVTTYIPGLNEVSNRVHDLGEYVAQEGNAALSPLFGAIGTVAENVDPFQATLKRVAPEQHGAVKEWITDHPIDTMALVAAAYFGAAAAGGAAGSGAGAGASAAPAASGGAGAAGGTAGLQAAGTAAITPTFASGAVSAPTAFGAGSTTGSLLGASGAGTLGTAGTSAATSLLTPTFSSFVAGGGAGSGLLGAAKTAYGYAKPGISAAQNVQRFANAQPRRDPNADATALADRILNSYSPDDNRNKIARSMTMNRFRR